MMCAGKESLAVKKLSWLKFLTLSFVLFTIHILLHTSSLIPRVHSQTFRPILEGTKWEGGAEISLNTVDVLTINADFVFAANGKVGIAYRTQLAGLRPKWRYNPFTEKYDTALEYTIISVTPGPPEVTTYRQNGRAIHIEFYDYYIDATINGNVMEGIIAMKSRPNKAKWVAERVSGASSNSTSNPNTVRNADGTLRPANGYEWVNPKDPNDFRVRLIPGLTESADGKLRPASGYEWVNPNDPKDFRVKLMPGLIKTEDGFRPATGYRWVNPKDPNDFRVERIP